MYLSAQYETVAKELSWKKCPIFGFFHFIFYLFLARNNQTLSKRGFPSLFLLLFYCIYWFGRNYPRRSVQVVGNRLHQILGMHF